MKFGVADYGMNVWDGGLYDIEDRLTALREIGFEGIERLSGITEADVLHKGAVFRKLGMDYTTCRGPDAESTIQWTAAFGREYVWIGVPSNTRDSEFDKFYRQVEIFSSACRKWNIKAAIHNHLGCRIETQEELEGFLEKCPDCELIFDTGHLIGAGGDPVEIIRKYHNRICVMHLKDVYITDPDAKEWFKRLRFCGLGGGNIAKDKNLEVMKALKEVGYNGWIFIEHDTHLQSPLIDLSDSLKYLKEAGF